MRNSTSPTSARGVRLAEILDDPALRFHTPAHIPNQEGFRFIGRDHDGNLIPCIVRKDPVGCHGAYDERDGTPCFMRLEAWSAYPSTSK